MKPTRKKTVLLIVVILLHCIFQLLHGILLRFGFCVPHRLIVESNLIFALIPIVSTVYVCIYFLKKRNVATDNYLIATGYVFLVPLTFLTVICPYSLADEPQWLGPTSSIYVVNPFISAFLNYFFVLAGALVIGWNSKNPFSKSILAAIPFFIFVLLFVILKVLTPTYSG